MLIERGGGRGRVGVVVVSVVVYNWYHRLTSSGRTVITAAPRRVVTDRVGIVVAAIQLTSRLQVHRRVCLNLDRNRAARQATRWISCVNTTSVRGQLIRCGGVSTASVTGSVQRACRVEFLLGRLHHRQRRRASRAAVLHISELVVIYDGRDGHAVDARAALVHSRGRVVVVLNRVVAELIVLLCQMVLRVGSMRNVSSLVRLAILMSIALHVGLLNVTKTVLKVDLNLTRRPLL
jgi:hypothetical protein